MHEISLVRNIFNTLESEFTAEEVANVRTITLKIGLLANVEPILLQNAFEAVTQTEDRFQQAKLAVNFVPIIIECPRCGGHTQVEGYRFICSHCQTPTNNLLSGTELLIERVDFAE